MAPGGPPAGPFGPVAPVEPGGPPAGPFGPVAPVEPGGPPAGPFGPVAPVEPGGPPAGPFGPVAPVPPKNSINLLILLFACDNTTDRDCMYDEYIKLAELPGIARDNKETTAKA